METSILIYQMTRPIDMAKLSDPQKNLVKAGVSLDLPVRIKHAQKMFKIKHSSFAN